MLPETVDEDPVEAEAASSSTRPSPSTIQKWIGTGFWAVSDQALFATSNFILNILLARWLTPSEYGAFAIAFSAFLLLATVHTALLTEPMLVFGPGRHMDHFRDYLAVLLNRHWRLTALLSLLLGVIAVGSLLASLETLPVAIGASALAAPFVLFQWLMRRACYVRLQPRVATAAGAGYAIIVVAGAYLLFRSGLLSVVSAFALMGFASLLAGAWLSHRLGLNLLGSARSGLLKEVQTEHWGYGRWAVGSGALTWVPGNVYFLLLPIWGGLEATGTFRALDNLILPLGHFSSAIGLILLPAFAGILKTRHFRRRMSLALLALASGGVVYWLVLIAFGDSLLHWLYGGKYDSFASVLIILAAVSLPLSLNTVMVAVLRALDRPQRVFWSYLSSSFVSLGIGLVLIAIWGVRGAAVGTVLTSAVLTLALSWHLRRELTWHPTNSDAL